MRTGADDGLKDLELQADLNIGTDTEGGHTVPEVVDRDIQDRVKEISPIRQIASQITVGTSDYKKLVNLHGTASGWVGETTSRTKTGTPTLEQISFPDGEIYANPATTQRMLDDSFLNVEAWLAEEVALEFAKQEGIAFITGDGSNKPFGFLSGTPVATADGDSPARAFGTLEYIPSGAAGAFAAGPGDSPSGTGQDVLLDTVYALKAAFRNNARWVLGRLTMKEIRKMKDVDGNYLFQRGLQAGQPDQILGFPITEAEDMPVIEADSFSIAFGDFRRGYKIVDRMGTRTLRDPYTDKPNVLFYTTKRVSGNIIDDEAIKLIKFAAS
jgi:HK97 family phage major capsid protein